MKLAIHLKNGGAPVVNNLQKIICRYAGTENIIEVTDFSNFLLSADCRYAFQGDNTVVVESNEILYLNFY